MDLPSLAPFPPANVRKGILPEEWEQSLESWILLIQKYLMLSAEAFAIKAHRSQFFVQFLVSYVQDSCFLEEGKSQQLRREYFLLVHRTMTEVQPLPLPLSEWNFLARLSLVYARNRSLSTLLNDTWNKFLDTGPSIETHKRFLITILEAGSNGPELEMILTQAVFLLRGCYCYGQFLMTGSDLIDALAIVYEQVEPSLKQKIVKFVYFCLTSLLGPQPKLSTLLDHLYSLKTKPLIKALIVSTPFLRRMRDGTSGQDNGRARSLIESLKSYETAPNGRPKKPIRRKIDKGKGRDRNHYGHSALGDMHIHKLSLVSQVQDLFPDLGSGFIVKLLDEYNDDTALVTDHLLNDDLPAQLKAANRSEDLPQAHTLQDHGLALDLAPHSILPLLPSRHNIHDNDDFDRLAIDTSKLRFGKGDDVTADELLASRRPVGQKAAILSALATFDLDDDERDDTYDVGDVGDTVDMTNEDMAVDMRQDVHEEALYNAYNMTPNLFNRDAETRRGKPRAALRTETGMTDEAIEGWGIMIDRDPRTLNKLEAKIEMRLGGRKPSQRALESTAWRVDPWTDVTGTEDSDGGGTARGRKGGVGRGSGRGRGQNVERGNAQARLDGQASQAARHLKHANKGSRANHNRRDQRAKKMARGGFPG